LNGKEEEEEAVETEGVEDETDVEESAIVEIEAAYEVGDEDCNDEDDSADAVEDDPNG